MKYGWKRKNTRRKQKKESFRKNGLIFEAVQKGYLCAANAKTNEPLLDKDGKEKLNSKGEIIMKSHRILAQDLKGVRAGFEKYGVEIPEKIKEKVADFKPKEREGMGR